MIRKLTIKNYQKHKHLELELGRVTTIVGPSRAGKSAVLRALAWLAVGNIPGFVPKGKTFIKHGAKRTVVSLHVGKHVIKRIRGDKGAYYLDGMKLAAFGTKVPDEVTAILNMGELNFQRQIGLPFWFSESAGQVSKHLNKIVDLSVIDDTLKNLNKMLGASKSKTEVVEERLASAKAERKSLKPVVECVADLEKLEKLEKVAQNHAIRARRLHDLVALATKHHKHMDQLTLVLLQGQSVLLAGSRWEKVWRRSIELRNQIVLHKLRESEAKAPPAWPDDVEHEQNNLAITQQQKQELEFLIQQHLGHEVLKAKAVRAASELSEKLKEFDTCPLCGQKTPS